MSQACKLCAHPDRARFEGMILRGTPYRQIAAEAAISHGAVARHKESHMARTVAAYEELQRQQREERNEQALQAKGMPGIPLMAPLPDADPLCGGQGRLRDDPLAVTETLLSKIDAAASFALSIGRVGDAAALFETMRKAATDLLPRIKGVVHLSAEDVEFGPQIRAVQELKRRDPAAADALRLALLAAEEEEAARAEGKPGRVLERDSRGVLEYHDADPSGPGEAEQAQRAGAVTVEEQREPAASAPWVPVDGAGNPVAPPPRDREDDTGLEPEGEDYA